MNSSLVDTDILSFFFRRDSNVVANFKKYLDQYGSINFSIISYYKILNGLLYKDAQKQLNKSLGFAKLNTIIPLTVSATQYAAEWQAKLRREGQPISHTDTLIAGIALANNFQLITNNTEHFVRIDSLKISNWSK